MGPLARPCTVVSGPSRRTSITLLSYFFPDRYTYLHLVVSPSPVTLLSHCLPWYTHGTRLRWPETSSFGTYPPRHTRPVTAVLRRERHQPDGRRAPVHRAGTGTIGRHDQAGCDGRKCLAGYDSRATDPEYTPTRLTSVIAIRHRLPPTGRCDDPIHILAVYP